MSVAAQPNIVTSGLVLSLDAGNPRSYSPNAFNGALDIFGWAGPGGGYQCTTSRDTTIDPSPAGGIPMKIATANPGTSAYIGTYNATNWNIATAASGQTWTASFWVKGSSAFTASMLIFEANSAGNYTTYGQGYFNVTTSWTRVSYSYTMTQATTVAVQMRMDCYNSSVNMWVDGLQVERVSSASTFNSRYNLNGATYIDVSTNGYNGILTNGPTYNSENVGYINFDGVNDYSISSGLQTFGNDMTWEAWVYCTQNISTYNMFMGRYLPYFSFYGGNSLYFSNYINNVQQTIQTATTLSLNTWYHAAFTTSYSAPNTTMTIYTNGVSSQTGTFSGTQNNFAGYGFMVGDGNNGSNSSWYPFKGRIGPVKVYNRTLSASEISQNFNALRGRFGL